MSKIVPLTQCKEIKAEKSNDHVLKRTAEQTEATTYTATDSHQCKQQPTHALKEACKHNWKRNLVKDIQKGLDLLHQDFKTYTKSTGFYRFSITLIFPNIIQSGIATSIHTWMSNTANGHSNSLLQTLTSAHWASFDYNKNEKHVKLKCNCTERSGSKVKHERS